MSLLVVVRVLPYYVAFIVVFVTVFIMDRQVLKTVEKNSQIVLTISTGKENKEVTVPNVKGKSEQEAKEAIEAANLYAEAGRHIGSRIQ